MDYSKMTDEELEKIAGTKNRAPDFSAMSNEQLEALASGEPKKGFLQNAVETINAYTATPSRAAAGAALKGENPFSAFGEQFGDKNDKSPSAMQLLDLASENIKIGPIGVNPNFKGPKPEAVGVVEAVAGKRTKQKYEHIDKDGNVVISEHSGIYEPLAFATELATDWTNALPLVAQGMKKASGGLSALLKSSKVADNVADTAKVAKTASDAQDGLGLLDAIKLANEGGPKDIKAVVESSKRLGFAPTPGMTSNSMALRGVESSLEQSPSIAGAAVRSNTDKVRKGLAKAAESLTNDKLSFSKIEVGDRVKSDILETIRQKYEPVSKSFDKIRESTAFMDVPDKSKLTVARNFLKHPDVALSPNSSWGQKASQFGDSLLNAKSVDDVKRLRTLVGGELRAATNPNDERVLNYIYGRLSDLEERTMKRAAIEVARTAPEGAQIGRGLIKDLRKAKSDYRGIVKTTEEITKQAGLKRSRGIDSFLSVIDDIPSEQVGDRLFKTKNIKALKTLQKEFPTSYDLVRRQKLTDIVEKATVKGEVDPAKLLRTVKDLGPEIIEVIFKTKNPNQVLSDIQTVIDSLPNKIGPSGTPQGEMFLNMLKPIFQAQEGARYIGYKALANPTIPIGKVVGGAQDAQNILSFKKAGQATVGGLSDLIKSVPAASAINKIPMAISREKK